MINIYLKISIIKIKYFPLKIILFINYGLHLRTKYLNIFLCNLQCNIIIWISYCYNCLQSFRVKKVYCIINISFNFNM